MYEELNELGMLNTCAFLVFVNEAAMSNAYIFNMPTHSVILKYMCPDMVTGLAYTRMKISAYIMLGSLVYQRSHLDSIRYPDLILTPKGSILGFT